MSSPSIAIDIDNPDPGDCPTTFTEQVQLLRELIRAELVGEYLPYVTGAATPAVEDQDKIWHRSDANGRPVGTFQFYSGMWRREYSGPGIVMYDGDPAVDFSGLDGLGTIGGQYDGFAICNGNNGTPDLSDKFIVGAKMNDLGVGYPGGAGPWQTTVDGTSQQSGGQKDITLTSATTYIAPTAALTVHRRSSDGETADAAGGGFGLGSLGALDLISANAGNETPDAIPTLPFYYALAFIKWVGYA